MVLQSANHPILQLRSDPPTIMGIASCGIVAQAPVSPSEQQFSRRRLQEDSAGEQMADGWNGDAELRRAIRELASARPGLLSFRLLSGGPVIEARTRSARSLARNAAAAMTSVMCRCHAGQERASQ